MKTIIAIIGLFASTAHADNLLQGSYVPMPVTGFTSGNTIYLSNGAKATIESSPYGGTATIYQANPIQQHVVIRNQNND